jgi:hypothetical protein
MKTKAIYYHAGCSVCAEAEQGLADALDPGQYEVEKVHLGTDAGRLPEAERLGVRSLPALVIENVVFHINHGADLSALK